MCEISLVKSDRHQEDSVLAGASGHWIIEDSIMLPNINTGINVTQAQKLGDNTPMAAMSPTRTDGRATTIPDTSMIIPGNSSEVSNR